MEFLRGQTLAEYVEQRGSLEPGEAREMFRQLRHALGQAHALGLVHRDLKPENIFMATPRRSDVPFTAKVLDFGITKMVQAARTAAANSQVIGSPFWMAPEQLEAGARISPATDVWALGLIAYFLLTGSHYWATANSSDASITGLLMEIVNDPMPPPSERAKAYAPSASLPEGFDAWFARMLTGPNLWLVARDSDSGRIAGTVNLGAIVYSSHFKSAYLGYYGMVDMADRGLMTERGMAYTLVDIDSPVGEAVLGSLDIPMSDDRAFDGRPRPLRLFIDAIYKIVNETFTGVRAVKAFTREPHERRRFRRATDEYYRKAMRVVKIDAHDLTPLPIGTSADMHVGDPVVAIGNAPTALFHLLEVVEESGVKPAAVVGIPVGFVGAAESKEALIANGLGLDYLVLRGRRGGSAITSAAINALSRPGI